RLPVARHPLRRVYVGLAKGQRGPRPQEVGGLGRSRSRHVYQDRGAGAHARAEGGGLEVARRDPYLTRSATEGNRRSLCGVSRFRETAKIMSELAALQDRALAELNACNDEAALRGWNTKYFGKQGEVLLAVKKVGSVPPAERRAYGQEANQVKETLTKAYEDALAR